MYACSWCGKTWIEKEAGQLIYTPPDVSPRISLPPIDQRPGSLKIKKLTTLIQRYSIDGNQELGALPLVRRWWKTWVDSLLAPLPFLHAEPKGFSIYCSDFDRPAWNRLFRRNSLGYYFVGRCHWRWSPDEMDVLGVTLRTDLDEMGDATHYGDENFQLKRLQEQNRSSDVEWASRKIHWLWRQGLASEAPPQIELAEKVKALSWDEYVDPFDHLPARQNQTGPDKLN